MATVDWTRGRALSQNEPTRFSKEAVLRSPVFISLKRDAHLFYKPWGAEKAELKEIRGSYREERPHSKRERLKNRLIRERNLKSNRQYLQSI